MISIRLWFPGHGWQVWQIQSQPFTFFRRQSFLVKQAHQGTLCVAGSFAVMRLWELVEVPLVHEHELYHRVPVGTLCSPKNCSGAE